MISISLYLILYVVILFIASYLISKKQNKEDFLIGGRERNSFQIFASKFAGAIGAGVAADYVMGIGRDNIREHENRLNTLMSNKLKDIDSISIIGPEDVSQRGGIFSFNIESWDPTEIAMHLDEEYNIAIRSGMHCVHSWFNSRSIEGTARASVYLYNNEADVKKFTEAIEDTIGN